MTDRKPAEDECDGPRLAKLGNDHLGHRADVRVTGLAQGSVKARQEEPLCPALGGVHTAPPSLWAVSLERPLSPMTLAVSSVKQRLECPLQRTARRTEDAFVSRVGAYNIATPSRPSFMY